MINMSLLIFFKPTSRLPTMEETGLPVSERQKRRWKLFSKVSSLCLNTCCSLIWGFSMRRFSLLAVRLAIFSPLALVRSCLVTYRWMRMHIIIDDCPRSHAINTIIRNTISLKSWKCNPFPMNLKHSHTWCLYMGGGGLFIVRVCKFVQETAPPPPPPNIKAPCVTIP